MLLRIATLLTAVSAAVLLLPACFGGGSNEASTEANALPTMTEPVTVTVVADEPTAPALAPRFKFLWPTSLELPPKCRPDVAKARVVGAVQAFNSGHTDSFAESFIETGGQLAPYDLGGRGFVGREAIEGFASERHEAGDGWTLTDLAPPLGEIGLPRETAYGAGLIVRQEAAQFRKPGGAKIVIDCASGLIRAWIGPPHGPPSK